MFRIRKNSAVALVLALAFATAGCGGDDDSSGGSGGDGEYTVLLNSDFTGPGKAYGDQFHLGMQAAADYLNETRGGILDREILIDPISNNLDASQATSLLEKYLNDEGAPDMAWAGTTNVETAALFPIQQRRGLLGGSGNDGGGMLQDGGAEELSLQFSTSTLHGASDKVASWFRDGGFTEVGILQEEAPYYADETERMKTAFEPDGVTPVVTTFATGAVDLAAQVQELKDAGVDAVYFEGSHTSLGYAIKARSLLGWTAPWLTDVAASALDITTLGEPSELQDLSLMTFRPSVAGVDLPGLDLLRKYAAEHTDIAEIGSVVPIHIAGLAWDQLLVFANAAEQAESVDPEDIANALEDFGEGANDPNYITYAKIAYSPDDHTPTLATPDDYPIRPVGPIVDGQIQAPQ